VIAPRAPGVAVVLAVVLLALAPLRVRAETPAEQARTLIARYHEDRAVLDQARALLETALEGDRHVETMITLARVCYLWGDLRAGSRDDKLAAYDRGREIGKRAVELAPKSDQAHLWYAVNTGRYGQTKGIFRSLALLPTMREEVQTLLTLAPRSPVVHALAGGFYFEVPTLLGGDRARAEEHYKKAVQLDPHYTVARVDLARLYLDTGRPAEARRELERVLAERAPTFIADWTVKDVPRAREILQSVRGR
jgi:tetratricopeptide (TPR) repeat protein